jgi:hypothetical protein
MPTRRRLSEQQLVSSLRRQSGAEAAKTASMLLGFSRENNLLIRRRHASVSIRMALGPGDRPATLFVVPETDRFYTYWLDHWPRRYRRVASRYATELRRVFPDQRVIAPQGTRHNTVRLVDVATRMRVVQRAVLQAVQGIRAINAAAAGALPESLVGLEGEARRRMVLHRKREGRLRDGRIAFVKNRTGALACEVKGCGFNFHAVYGKLGEDYAQVHHMRPLSYRTVPSKTRVSDLRVVCANCHAMIHLGGKSRSLAQITTALRAGISN